MAMALSDADEYDWNNDGIFDDDCDGDGIPDYLDPDPCNTDVPQGLSPNNDGLNDYLVIPGILRHPESRLQVFNRWGHAVYDSQGPTRTIGTAVRIRPEALSWTVMASYPMACTTTS